MLTAFFKDRNGKIGDYDFEVGKPIVIENPEHILEGITLVRADGRELQLIKEKFINLPYLTRADVMLYYGETAQMIVGNIEGLLKRD